MFTMRREYKLGAALVVLLSCVFGYLVYKKAASKLAARTPVKSTANTSGTSAGKSQDTKSSASSSSASQKSQGTSGGLMDRWKAQTSAAHQPTADDRGTDPFGRRAPAGTASAGTASADEEGAGAASASDADDDRRRFSPATSNDAGAPQGAGQKNQYSGRYAQSPAGNSTFAGDTAGANDAGGDSAGSTQDDPFSRRYSKSGAKEDPSQGAASAASSADDPASDPFARSRGDSGDADDAASSLAQGSSRLGSRYGQRNSSDVSSTAAPSPRSFDQTQQRSGPPRSDRTQAGSGLAQRDDSYEDDDAAARSSSLPPDSGDHLQWRARTASSRYAQQSPAEPAQPEPQPAPQVPDQQPPHEQDLARQEPTRLQPVQRFAQPAYYEDEPPPAAPAPSARPRQAADTYVVQPNDSFWVISKRVFGSGAYYQAIHEHNRERFPNQDSLQVGDVLEIPPAEYLQKTYPDLCPKPRKGAPLPPASSATPPPGSRVYLVEEGDTLFDIARHELGSPKRWVEIYDLNRQVLSEDLHYLKPGLELILPPRHSGRETPAQRTTTRSPRS